MLHSGGLNGSSPSFFFGVRIDVKKKRGHERCFREQYAATRRKLEESR